MTRRALAFASLVPAALAMIFAASCGPPRGRGLIGVSSVGAGAGGDAGPPDGATALATQLLPKDFRASFARLSKARFATRGHLYERYLVDVYANDAARATYEAGRGDFPAGAILVKEHFDRLDSKQGPIMVMEKREKGFDAERGDWRYAIVGAAGNVVSDGKNDKCAGCHGDAPQDHVFRIVE